MTREQLAHVLRSVSQLTGDPDVVVIGSQSILGSYSEDELPPEATGSIEVDTAFLSDPGDAKSDLVDVNIGELSEFHEEYGYYPQGVSINTGVFPTGWRDRLVTYKTQDTEPGRGLCLEPHDCILGKLVRFEEKDVDFATALVRAGLIELNILADRVETLPTDPANIERIRNWIDAMKDQTTSSRNH
jgi:Nucleotidyltransferase of unknown function (DUF6036)